MTIAIIGAGNVGTHFGKALYNASSPIVGVYSRRESSATALAKQLSCLGTTSLEVLPQADLYLLALADDAIAEVAGQLAKQFPKAIIVHTAGSVSLNTLSLLHQPAGVIYPLQTFSKERMVDFSEVPLFVEATDKATELKLLDLAKTLSHNVALLSSEKRRQLHLAAVFACNFVNHCYALAEDALSNSGVNIEVLLPLIKETAQKVYDLSPATAQTGPAVRWDKGVMAKHEELLNSSPAMQEIYRLMSQSIHEKALQHAAQAND